MALNLGQPGWAGTRKTFTHSFPIFVGIVHYLYPAMEQVQAFADISCSELSCHSNKTCALIANPANSSAQLKGTPYHSPKLHPGPCSSVESGEG